jgi:hypothetical protein
MPTLLITPRHRHALGQRGGPGPAHNASFELLSAGLPYKTKVREIGRRAVFE